MKLPEFNGPLYKGLMTTLQGFIAAILLITAGVFSAVHGTPGCFDAVIGSLTNSGIQIAGWFGIGAGVTSYAINLVINKFRQS